MGRSEAGAAPDGGSDAGPPDRAPADADRVPGSARDSAVRSDASRCAWCAGGDGELKKLRLRIPDQIALSRLWVELPVHPRHERPVRRYAARFRRDGRRFVFTVLAWFVVVIASFTVLHAVDLTEAARERWTTLFVEPALITTLGLALFLFPFATPLTNRLIGIRHAVLLTRGAGLVFAGIGLWKAVQALL